MTRSPAKQSETESRRIRAPAEKQKFSLNTVIDFISSVFQPIIPALSGAGMVKALLALLISAVATAVVTFLLPLKFEKAEPAAETKSEPVPAFEVPENTVAAPVEGTVVPMEEIPDETFSAGVLGQGLGIRPVNGEVLAPFSGTVTCAPCRRRKARHADHPRGKLRRTRR